MKVNIEEREDSMGFGSIDSIEYWEYRNTFNNEYEVFAKLSSEQIDLLRKYFQWATAKNYKEIIPSSKLADKQLKGLICGLSSISIKSETGIVYVGCVIQEDSMSRIVDVDKLADIGANESEIRILKNIINETLNELHYICYINDNQVLNEFELKRYDRLRDILAILYDDNQTSKENEIFYCYQFVKYNLPLPLSLIKYYKNALIEQYRIKVAENILEELADRGGYDKKIIAELRDSNIYLVQLINSYVKQDEIKKERQYKMLELLLKFKLAYDKLSNGGKTDFRRLVEASKQTAYYVTTALGERLATKNEIKSIVSGVYKKDTYFLPKEKREKLLLFGWCVTGDERYYYQSGAERYKDDFTKLEKLHNKIMDAIEWLSSEEFFEKDIKELAKGAKPIEYPDKADDEIKEGSLVAMLKYIKEHGTEDTSYDRIALDIAEKCLKYKKYAISEKQLYIVKKVYEKLTKPVEQEPIIEEIPKKLKDNKPNLFNDELVDKIKEIVKHPLFKKSGFVAKIIESVLRYKKCSEKQYDVIMEEYKKLGLSKRDPFDVFGIPVEIESDTKDTKKNTIVSPDSFFVEDDDIINTDINILSNDEFGTLSDMSDFLGLGGAIVGE